MERITDAFLKIPLIFRWNYVIIYNGLIYTVRRKLEMSKYSKYIACVLTAVLIISLFPVVSYGASKIDLANCSERFLSDFAISEGGSVFADAEGNIVFEIERAAHSLKFKCTGASPEEEQNAICLWLYNATASKTINVDVVFMDASGKQKMTSYTVNVTDSESDAYLFIPSAENEYIVNISLKASGISYGSFTVMGIWHCYYSFAGDIRNVECGTVDRCEFKNGGKSVFLEGTVVHDVVVASKQSRINVYRLLPGEVLSDDFVKKNSPIAESSMSRSFRFEIKNEEGSDYASAYAITINSPDGSIEYILEDKFYPDTECREEEIFDFKGMATSLEYLPGSVGASSLIIDVDLAEIISERLSGYLYSFGGVNYCFRREVVDEIKRRIASHKSDGGSVYLRIINSSAGIGSPFSNIAYNADGKAAVELYAAMSYLAETYSGYVEGIVVGIKFDTPYRYENLIGERYSSYIRQYSDYLSVVRTAVKNADPSMRVILPISSNTEYATEESFGSEQYPMFAMLISLLEVYSLQSRGSITLMVSDSTFPYVKEILQNDSLPDDGGEGSSDSTVLDKNEIMNLTCENVHVFERFLDYIVKSFSVTDKNYFYSWRPYGFREASDLQLAYIYNYLHLSSRERIYSFFCDFSADERDDDFSKSEDMKPAFDAMGSESGKKYAENLLSSFGDLSFNGIPGYDGYSVNGASGEKLNHVPELPQGIVGSVPMIDFSSVSGVSGWRNGAYSEAMSVVSVGEYKNVIRTTMHPPAYSSEFSEIIYDFGRELNLSEVSYITSKLIIGEKENAGAAKQTYSVKITLGGKNQRGVCEYNAEILPGEEVNISVDTSSFKGMSTVSYMKISVQNNTEVEDELLLYVCEIAAKSRTLNDDSLRNLFEKPADGEISDQDSENKDGNRLFILLFFFAFASMSVIAVIAFKKSKEQE